MAIDNLALTTELEAVNAMLRAIGEAPVSTLTGATQVDVVAAIGILRDLAREVQEEGWRFNTEFGMEVLPTAEDFAWVDSEGVTTLLNIYKKPTGVVRWTISSDASQVTYPALDVAERPSKVYVESLEPVLVLYDRANNRDGFPSSERSVLYLDVVWLFDFEQLPETARRYIVVRAARQFAQEVLGSSELASFKESDESRALRALLRDQGDDDEYNVFNNPDLTKHLGSRPRYSYVTTSRRGNAGPA